MSVSNLEDLTEVLEIPIAPLKVPMDFVLRRGILLCLLDIKFPKQDGLWEMIFDRAISNKK